MLFPGSYMIGVLSLLQVSGLDLTPFSSWPCYFLLPLSVPLPMNPQVPPLSPAQSLATSNLIYQSEATRGRDPQGLTCMFVFMNAHGYVYICGGHRKTSDVSSGATRALCFYEIVAVAWGLLSRLNCLSSRPSKVTFLSAIVTSVRIFAYTYAHTCTHIHTV